MCEKRGLKRVIVFFLVLCVTCCSFIFAGTESSFAATDNSTTLLSNVKNSGKGKISFTIKAPAGFNTYYQVVAKNAKPIMNSQSSLSVDIDDIKGVITNKTGTTNKTSTITVNVKLLGDYIVKVGVGGYYNSNSSVRQSASVKSRMTSATFTTKQWTSQNKTDYANKKKISLSTTGGGVISGATLLLMSATVSGAVAFGLACYADFSGKYDAILTITQKLVAGEYVGYYIAENSAGTGVTLYYATFNSAKTLKNKVALRTYLYSNYIPVI